MAPAVVFLLWPAALTAQNRQVTWNEQEKPIVAQLRGLRSLTDNERPDATKRLALQIRQLPASAKKEGLAEQLANLATEGDPGHDTLQEVAATLAESLDELGADAPGDRSTSYATLAQLVRYEHVQVSSHNPHLAAALIKLEAADQRRQSANFTLPDLEGQNWTLKDPRGKIVLVNFWATWCPPCRKEMPDLEALYQQFRERGLVVLAITDEDKKLDKVKQFIAEHKFSYPILLDAGRKVNELFQVEGIPKSFLYDRDGRLVAEAIDMRTRSQFLEMFAQAGLK
jgi:peroxiredoxin